MAFGTIRGRSIDSSDAFFIARALRRDRATTQRHFIAAVRIHASPEHSVARGYGNPDQVVTLAPWMAKVNPLDRVRTVSEFDEVWGVAEVT